MPNGRTQIVLFWSAVGLLIGLVGSSALVISFAPGAPEPVIVEAKPVEDPPKPDPKIALLENQVATLQAQLRAVQTERQRSINDLQQAKKLIATLQKQSIDNRNAQETREQELESRIAKLTDRQRTFDLEFDRLQKQYLQARKKLLGG